MKALTILQIVSILCLSLSQISAKAVESDKKPEDPKKNQCKKEQLRLYTGNIDALILRQRDEATERLGDICDGISEESCCKPSMFKNIAKYWKKAIDPKNDILVKYINNIHKLIEIHYPRLSKLARKSRAGIALFIKGGEYGGIGSKQAKKLTSAIQALSEKTENLEKFNFEWKPAAEECLDFMAKATKGAFCSICDSKEYSRFSNSNSAARILGLTDYLNGFRREKFRHLTDDLAENGIKFTEWVSEADAYAFSNKCGNYINSQHRIIRFISHMQEVYKWKNVKDNKHPIIEKPRFKDPTERRKIWKAMKTCANDRQKCKDPRIMSYWWTAPMTKFDMINYEFVDNLTKNLDYMYDEHVTLKTKIVTTRLLRNRVLEGVEFNRQANGMNQFFDMKKNRKLLQSVNFRVHKRYSLALYTMDTNLMRVPLGRTKLFEKGKRCPIAPLFSAKIDYMLNERLQKDNDGNGYKICKMVTKSCCTTDSFLTFEIGWKQSAFRIEKTYLAERNLLNFLTNDLIKDEYFNHPPQNNSSAGCFGKTNSAKCQVLYDLIKKAIYHYKMYEGKYQKDQLKCQRKLENIRAELRCAACDVDASQWFDNKNKQVVINRTVTNKFIHACYDYDVARAQLVFGVFYAYLNYAQQINPILNISHSILFKIFSNKIQKCSEWAQFANASVNSDMTAGRECLIYAYEKMNKLLIDSTQIRINRYMWQFFFEIVNTLTKPAKTEEVEEIMPDIVKPLRIKPKQKELESKYKTWHFIMSALDDQGLDLSKYWANGLQLVKLGETGSVINTLDDA